MVVNSQGYSILEITLVIVITSIISAVSLPHYVDLSDETASALIQHDKGVFASSVNSAIAKWHATGSRDTNIIVQGNIIPINGNGFPWGGANTHENCATLFDNLVVVETPTQAFPPVAVDGDPGYRALGFGNFCYFMYEPDTTPLRYIRYNTDTGEVIAFTS